MLEPETILWTMFNGECTMNRKCKNCGYVRSVFDDSYEECCSSFTWKSEEQLEYEAEQWNQIIKKHT